MPVSTNSVDDYWQVKQYRLPSEDASKRVVIEAGIYHDPDQLDTTRDMVECSEGEAYHEHGAVACSECFKEQTPAIYPNPAIR